MINSSFLLAAATFEAKDEKNFKDGVTLVEADIPPPSD
jgi:hypothetical protein